MAEREGNLARASDSGNPAALVRARPSVDVGPAFLAGQPEGSRYQGGVEFQIGHRIQVSVIGDKVSVSGPRFRASEKRCRASEKVSGIETRFRSWKKCVSHRVEPRRGSNRVWQAAERS